MINTIPTADVFRLLNGSQVVERCYLVSVAGNTWIVVNAFGSRFRVTAREPSQESGVWYATGYQRID